MMLVHIADVLDPERLACMQAHPSNGQGRLG